MELIIDIGSASVGVCFASRAEDGKSIISHVRRVPLRADSGNVRDNIRELALKALREALEDMPRLHPGIPVHVILAAPWYAAKLQTISLTSEKAIRIGQPSVARAVENARKEGSNVQPKGRETLESAVSQVYVNGYPTALRKTLKGASLEIRLYESEGDSDFVKIIRQAFPRARVTFHTFPFVAFAVLRALRKEDSFTLIDIGGEITDVAVVHRSGLSLIASFPEGSLSLARDIAGERSIADAFSRMTLFAKDELSPEENASFSAIFNKAAEKWRTAYARLMEETLATVPMPRTVFLVSDKEPLAWFQKIFSTAGDVLPVRPTLITPEFFEDSVSLGENARYDSFLSLGALFSELKQEGIVK
jgi:hypothetical protein